MRNKFECLLNVKCYTQASRKISPEKELPVLILEIQDRRMRGIHSSAETPKGAEVQGCRLITELQKFLKKPRCVQSHTGVSPR